MHEGAAHLVDRVLPHLNYRQWVFTVPKWLRAHLALDAKLNSNVLRLMLREIFRWQRRKACRDGHRYTRTAAVTFLQRFGSAIQLNPHFHSLLPDGVFAPAAIDPNSQSTPLFIPISGPSDEEAALLQRVFAIDVFVCTGCGGRRRIIAAITQPAVARAILTHLGLDNPQAARAPPPPLSTHFDDYAVDAPSFTD